MKCRNETARRTMPPNLEYITDAQDQKTMAAMTPERERPLVTRADRKDKTAVQTICDAEDAGR